MMSSKTTLIITHDHCALHGTRVASPERPKRLKWVMDALQILERDIKRTSKASPLDIREVKTSEPMLAALSQQLLSLARTTTGGAPPGLLRSESVGYLEEKILPAVKAVHTQAYISRLASTCVSLMDKAEGAKVEIDGDTVVSASSLSAALCAVLSCCYAVDACCDANLPYKNAFAVIRPPGHHAGANGPTVGPDKFAEVGEHAAHNAQPAASVRMPPPPPAFAFTAEPVPCDGLDCSQGFCLLNNAAIAARHALLCHAQHLTKVAIIDIDLHHGNGTEEIVRGWTDVMYGIDHPRLTLTLDPHPYPHPQPHP